MNEALPPLPVGTSSFEALRESGQLYVDKTALVHELAVKREKFFLTRPRRFGKSLLVSTFASLFAHGLKYFSGLAIERLWKDRTYTVVELDFSEMKSYRSAADFSRQLSEGLMLAFGPAGFRYAPDRTGDVIRQLSAWMKTLPDNSLVLLVDEYDAPQTAALDDRALFDAVRAELARFYGIIKPNDACMRFMFITGITKFNQTGIFSELNSFTDISLFPRFGALLGYAEGDIDRYFDGYVTRAARALSMTKAGVRDRLREHYDGYSFDRQVSVHVYSPWSVLKFFNWPDQGGFQNYWVTSGGRLTLLEKYLSDHALRSPEDYAEEKELTLDDLESSADVDEIDDVVLLTQAGYLTLKRVDDDACFVGYPNREVADSLARLYRRQLLCGRSLSGVGAGRLAEAVRTGNAGLLFEAAVRAFAAIDYAEYPVRSEKTCQAFLQLFIAGSGFGVRAETHGALGRSDLEVEADVCHWVIELKFLRTKAGEAAALLQEAVEQVRSRGYGMASRKRLVRVAAVFSEERRNFVCWADAEDRACAAHPL